MTQTQIDRAVAAAIGESLPTVRRHGFSLPGTLESDNLALVLDCPFCGRVVPYPGRARDGAPFLAECLRCDVCFGFDEAEVYAAPAEAAHAAAAVPAA